MGNPPTVVGGFLLCAQVDAELFDVGGIHVHHHIGICSREAETDKLAQVGVVNNAINGHVTDQVTQAGNVLRHGDGPGLIDATVAETVALQDFLDTVSVAAVDPIVFLS